MKMVVCQQCGNSLLATSSGGKIYCPVCDGSGGVEVEVPSTLTCDTCGRQWTISSILKRWVDIPFYNHHDETFYDGCEGWH